MANDQYQIPKGYAESDIRAELRAIQASDAQPEKEAAPYQTIKNYEAKIFSYREAALAMQPKQKGFLNSLVFRPQNNVLNELIEQESRIGGQLFGEGHKFWLDTKPSSAPFHTDVADWYHTQVNPMNPKEPIVLRFQTTPYSIHKLYNGREYTPTVQDLEYFVGAVEAYTSAVLPLYPLDQTIDELSQDDVEFGASSRAA